MKQLSTIINADNYDDMKERAEGLKLLRVSTAEIGKQLGISKTYARYILINETYEDFRAYVNETYAKAHAIQMQRKAENAAAREWSNGNEYKFGSKVTVESRKESKATKYRKFPTIVSDTAWKLVAKYPNDEDVRSLLEAVIIYKRNGNR